MQTTLLGLAIAFIIALIAALVGPYFIDWNQFRPQFEAEATRIIGTPVRVGGKLDARLLPAPSLQLHSVVLGGANDLGKVRADKLDVEFSLGSLMRGEVRATELTINGMSLDLGLDAKGRIDWPATTGTVNLGSLAIDRVNLTGRIALHDAASRSTLELNDIAFSGDVRSLAGSVRGDGNFMLSGTRYPFRVSSGQGPDGNGTRVHLNIDPGQRALAIDLDGVLNFDARAPRFEGAMTLVAPPVQKGRGNDPPWRIAAKVKTDYSAARLEQIEATYGPEERALKLSGSGDIRFGAELLLRAALSARQLDADRFVARENAKDNATEPVRALPTLRALASVVPHLPIPAQIELASEQVMLGGRPLQDIAAELHGDDKSWSLRRLEFRAPGATRVSLSEASAKSVTPDRFKAALSVESSDPEALLTWLQGRGEIAYRSQKPLRLRGDVTVAPEGFAIDAMKADIEGGTVEGRVVVSHRQVDRGSRIDAELKAERLDLDAATAFVRSLAGPQGEWPEEGRLSLDIGRATSAGQDLSPLLARLAYSPAKVSLEQLKIGQLEGVTLDGAGNFDRANATGWFALNSSAASLSRLTSLIVPFSPALAARLNAMGTSPGPARLKLTLDLTGNAGQSDRVQARATADLDSLLQANRKVADDGVGIERESVPFGQVVDGLAGPRGVVEIARGGRLPAQDDVLADGEDRNQHEVLVHHADAVPDRGASGRPVAARSFGPWNVGNAVGRRRATAPHDGCQDHERQDVGRHAEQILRDVDARIGVVDRLAEAKDQGRDKGANRRPLAEDHGRQRDVASTISHIGHERVGDADGEKSARQSG